MRPECQPTVYILASGHARRLSTGVTSHLFRRIHEHRQGAAPGFAGQRGTGHVVWFELHATMDDAIRRELRIRRWNRARKAALIERDNPAWRDLAEDLGFAPLGQARQSDAG